MNGSNKNTPLFSCILLLLSGLLGFLSMGFQLVASRLLAPEFGSSIVVWAFLISTFLFAFSAGSMLGGWACRDRGRIAPAWLLGLSVSAAIGFAINTFAAGPILRLVGSATENMHLALLLSCAALFILPIASISAFAPICAQALSTRGSTPGLASGLVYGISTIGNIAGVMTAAFYLIPHFRISTLLLFWLMISCIVTGALSWLLVRPFNYVECEGLPSLSPSRLACAPPATSKPE